MSVWKPAAWLAGLLFWAWVNAPVLAQQAAGDPMLGLPASSVQAAPASGVPAVLTAAENYEAGVKAEGKGDVIGALTLFKLAADEGYAPAQGKYADSLRRGQLHPEALKYYRMSVKGDKGAEYGLGAMYEEGDGIKKDYSIARFLFGLAAEQGHKEAAFRLADAYIKGQDGLDEKERNGPEALAVLRRAAGHNYLPAMDALAVAYRQGKYGLTADPDQADVVVGVTNKLRGVVVKEKKKSALFKLLKGDPEKKPDTPQ